MQQKFLFLLICSFLFSTCNAADNAADNAAATDRKNSVYCESKLIQYGHGDVEEVRIYYRTGTGKMVWIKREPVDQQDVLQKAELAVPTSYNGARG